MSKIKIYCLALCGLLLAACSGGDADDPDNGGKKSSTPVTISLSLSTSANGASRASTAGSWTAAAVNGEKMKNWFVIIAQGTTIKKIITSKKASDSNPLEEETYDDAVTLESGAGTYDFYSFANMELTDLDKDLTTSSTTLPSGLSDGKKTFQVDGNGFDISSNFIPMSNKQTIAISETSGTVDVNLWVVRMLAKVELRITNDTGSNLTLSSITLSDLTKNAADNLKLLPNPVNYGDEKVCEPNLGTSATKETCTFGVASGELPFFVSTTSSGTTYTKQSSALTIEKDGTANVVFYVNESVTPTNDQGLFILTLNTANSDSKESADGTKRYALISTKMESGGGTWDGQIARNDYHIISVLLTDYKFEIDHEQYEAIGVIPYWVNDNGVFTCTFYNPGHFHIKPKVTKISTNTALDYDDSGKADAPTWSLSNFSASITGYKNAAIYASTTDTNHEDKDGKKLSYNGTPLWSAKDHLVYGHFNYTLGKAWCSLSVIVNDGSKDAKRTYTYQLCLNREEIEEGSSQTTTDNTVTSNTKSRAAGSNVLFGYGKFIKAE